MPLDPTLYGESRRAPVLVTRPVDAASIPTLTVKFPVASVSPVPALGRT